MPVSSDIFPYRGLMNNSFPHLFSNFAAYFINAASTAGRDKILKIQRTQRRMHRIINEGNDEGIGNSS